MKNSNNINLKKKSCQKNEMGLEKGTSHEEEIANFVSHTSGQDFQSLGLSSL